MSNYTVFFLLILLVLHLVGNVIWVILNGVPPSWDAALHTYLSIRFLEYAKDLGNFNIVEFLKISDYYPPLVHLVGSVFSVLGGDNYKVIQLTGTFFFLISIVVTYLYSYEIFKNKVISLYSAFFYSFFLTIYQESRTHMIDVPLTAMILITAYFLKKSDNLQNRKFSVLFFLFLALSFLTKWYAIVFLIVPIAYEIVLIVRRRESRKIWRNISWGMALLILTIAPWYLVNLQHLLALVKVSSTAEMADPVNLFGLQNLLFYFKLNTIFETSFTGMIFVVVSLFLAFIKREKRIGMIFLTVFTSYIIFTFIGNKNIRYLIPSMPYVALIMGWGLNEIISSQGFILKLFASFTIFYVIFSYFILSFGVPSYPAYKYAFDLPLIGWTDVYYLHNDPVKVIYDKSKLDYEQILKDVAVQKSGKINFLVLSDSTYLNSGLLNPYLYSSIKSRRREINLINYDTVKDVRNIDIVLVPQKYVGAPDGLRNYDTLIKLKEYFLKGDDPNFQPVGEYYFRGDGVNAPDSILLFSNSSPL